MAKAIIIAVFVIIVTTSLVYAADEHTIGIKVEKKESSSSFNPLTVALVTSILSLLIMLVLTTEKYIIKRKPRFTTDSIEGIHTVTEPIEEKELTETKSEKVEKFLKEDEQTVINILRMKEGSCTQGTLRVVTNFSKAKLSRILSELAERGVVHKESRGKKNVVSLRIDKKSFFEAEKTRNGSNLSRFN